MEKGIVLQKYIAQSGFCSRREAEELIRTGKVTVQGKRAELGMYAQGGEEIRVRGQAIQVKTTHTYIALNKPKGYTCSNRVFPGERNIFELIGEKGKLFSIGRLDKDSRGLIIVTSDGDLDNYLSHPRYGHEKEYEVQTDRIRAEEEEDIVRSLKKGVNIGEEDGIAKAKRVQYLQNGRFIITLTTGKKRQIRRMLGALEHDVLDLKRISFAELKLGSLEEGKWRHLDEKEIWFLKGNSDPKTLLIKPEGKKEGKRKEGGRERKNS